MTKEKFILICQNIASAYDNNTPQGAELSKSEMLKLCNLFFESNVVIHKGENRHPYADLLHEWIEDASIVIEELSEPQRRWDETDTVSFGYAYRIKPQEQPIYEYQYAVVTCVSGSARLEWLTPIEAVAKYGNNAYAIDKTKRERK